MILKNIMIPIRIKVEFLNVSATLNFFGPIKGDYENEMCKIKK